MDFNLFLDDIRHPYDAFYYLKDSKYLQLKWVVVRSFDEFIKVIKRDGLPNLVSFDHDLADEHYGLVGQSDLTLNEYYYQGDREMTGYDCAKWLCDYCYDNNLKFPTFLVHSANTVGADNIRYYIKNFLKHNPELT